MSRVTRRAGTKALVCLECQRIYGKKSGKIIINFRGRSKSRLDLHLKEVHGQ